MTVKYGILNNRICSILRALSFINLNAKNYIIYPSESQCKKFKRRNHENLTFSRIFILSLLTLFCLLLQFISKNHGNKAFKVKHNTVCLRNLVEQDTDLGVVNISLRYREERTKRERKKWEEEKRSRNEYNEALDEYVAREKANIMETLIDMEKLKREIMGEGEEGHHFTEEDYISNAYVFLEWNKCIGDMWKTYKERTQGMDDEWRSNLWYKDWYNILGQINNRIDLVIFGRTLPENKNSELRSIMQSAVRQFNQFLEDAIRDYEKKSPPADTSED